MASRGGRADGPMDGGAWTYLRGEDGRAPVHKGSFDRFRRVERNVCLYKAVTAFGRESDFL